MTSDVGIYVDYESRNLYDYECRSYMTSNVAVKWLRMSQLSLRVTHIRLRMSQTWRRMCSRFFRISRFYHITWKFRNIWISSNSSHDFFFFENIMFVLDSSAHPKFSNVPFYRMTWKFQNVRIPSNFLHDLWPLGTPDFANIIFFWDSSVPQIFSNVPLFSSNIMIFSESLSTYGPEVMNSNGHM